MPYNKDRRPKPGQGPRKPWDKKKNEVQAPERKIKRPKPIHPLERRIEKEGDSAICTAVVKEILDTLKLEFSKEQIAQFLDQLLLVKEMNREINLVSRVSVEKVLLVSLWESLAAVTNIDWKKGNDILDLGTGGGFPGIPLSIALPDDKMTLLDSRRSKILSVRRIVEQLSLDNTTVVHDRAETYVDHEESRFDVIAARGVGPLKEIGPWASALMKDRGVLLAWKGPEGIREMKDLPSENWTLKGRIAIQPHRHIMMLEYVRG